MKLDIHLHFKGQCTEAFQFYAQCLGTKVDFSMTYGQAPKEAQGAPEMHDKIMHTSMKVGGTTLLGDDAPPGHQETPQGFAVTINVDDSAEAERIYGALSQGGKISMPIAETFWAKRFAMFTDKFGTPWMVNCRKPM